MKGRSTRVKALSLIAIYYSLAKMPAELGRAAYEARCAGVVGIRQAHAQIKARAFC